MTKTSLLSMLALGVLATSLPATLPAQDVQPPAKKVPVGKNRPADLPLKYVGPPTKGAISAADLMTRIYKFADDSMMGREAGTVWNDKGTDYIASELKRMGLEPAGENGTYFQSALKGIAFQDSSWVGVDDARYKLWTDFAPRFQGNGSRAFDGATAIYGGQFGDTASYISREAAAGKVVVVRIANGRDGRPDYSTVNRAQLTSRYFTAAAIAVVQLDYLPPGYLDQTYKQALVAPRNVSLEGPASPTYFYITSALGDAMMGVPVTSAQSGQAGKTVRGRIAVTVGTAPGRNVLAVLRGSDPKLRGQYVAVGAHNDHVGFNRMPVDHDSVKAVMMHAGEQGADGPSPNPTPEQWVAIRKSLDSLRVIYPSRPDSIYNGADDDGSGSMAVLEIAERFATAAVKPKRSVLFAFHVGEEKGLWGSALFTDEPTVPRDSIVAQLNVDMVGRGGARDVAGSAKEGGLIRGGPGYLQLVGSRRLSTELGDLVEQTNKATRLGLKFDYSLDANGHPQNIYCRSDHYMYARYGIPVTFFTTGGHADYHQVTDEPQYIDYAHTEQVAKLIHATAMNVANLGHRIVVDAPKPDPKGACRQ